MILEFFVPGLPITEGSAFARKLPDGKAIVVREHDKELRVWRKAITAAASAAMPGPGPLFSKETPVWVEVTFGLVRGKTVTREWPTVKPDLDKLFRAIGDGMTDAGVFVDDAQIVDEHPIKTYSDRPGAHVRAGIYGSWEE